MQNFALIGVGGYIAPRHLKAIKDTGNHLSVGLDKNDSVGIIDSYFPNANFFTEFERFDRHLDKLRRNNSKDKINYISICSPNYLHDSHIRFALRSDADAICEKPLVLNPWNIDGLKQIEDDTGRSIFTILQLRLHPTIIALRNEVLNSPPDKIFDVELTYITSRGKWYLQSWKGDETKSGGIATNIGVHFFDMLHYVFGKLKQSHVYLSSPIKSSGYLEFEKANVRWFLSIDESDIPKDVLETGQRTFRSITYDKKEIEFSAGFTDLHTETYKEILDGRGFGIEDNRAAIELVSDIRNSNICRGTENAHPFVRYAKT